MLPAQSRFRFDGNAAAVKRHLVMPKSFGLFQRAGMESGAFAAWTVSYMEDQEASWKGLVKNCGCSKAPNRSSDGSTAISADFSDRVVAASVLECMEGVDAATVLSCVPDAAGYGPTVDGVELVDAPWVLAAAGKLAPGVPVIAGAVSEDGDKSITQNGGPAELRAWIKETMTDLGANASLVARLQDAYTSEVSNASSPGEGYSEAYWAVKHFLADSEMLCSARRIARWVSNAAAAAAAPPPKTSSTGSTGSTGSGHTAGGYVYQFRHSSRESCQAGQGAKHSVEIPFVFHVTAGSDPEYHIAGQEELALSDAVTSFWAQFVRDIIWRDWLLLSFSFLPLRSVFFFLLSPFPLLLPSIFFPPASCFHRSSFFFSTN